MYANAKIAEQLHGERFRFQISLTTRVSLFSLSRGLMRANNTREQGLSAIMIHDERMGSTEKEGE